jgi:hypothetical protein
MRGYKPKIKGGMKMIKRVSLDKVDEKIRYFFKKLRTEKDQYILEIGGEPLIGVVPPWQVTEIKQRKDELLSMLKEVWSKTGAISGKRIEKEVEEAVRAARRRV